MASLDLRLRRTRQQRCSVSITCWNFAAASWNYGCVIDQPVLVVGHTTTLEVLLHVIPQRHIRCAVKASEFIPHVPFEVGFDASTLKVPDDSTSQFYDEDNAQKYGEGHKETIAFLRGATAAEEGDNRHDGT